MNNKLNEARIAQGRAFEPSATEVTFMALLRALENHDVQVRLAKVLQKVLGHVNYMNRTGKEPVCDHTE